MHTVDQNKFKICEHVLAAYVRLEVFRCPLWKSDSIEGDCREGDER